MRLVLINFSYNYDKRLQIIRYIYNSENQRETALPYHTLYYLDTNRMRDTAHPGYLLIELMIAIILLCAMGLSIGKLSGSIAEWHRTALIYLKATTIADRVINGQDPHTIKDPLFTVQKSTSRPFDGIPYTAITVTITAPCGTQNKTITFCGGRAEYHA